MDTKNSWSNESRYVYVDSIKKDVRLINISETLDASYKSNYLYRIGVGDQISVTVWGLPDIFPIINVGVDQNLEELTQMEIYFFHMLV